MTDIVERLRYACGDGHPQSDGCVPMVPVEMLTDAAATIVRLRGMLEDLMAVSGKAERGPSFAEITKDFPRAPKDLCGNE